MNQQMEDQIADAATQIYNLGIATTDKPAHERFGHIVKVVRQMVEEALEQQRDRMLKASRN